MRAYGRLVDVHQAAVRSFLRRLTGSWADADDIAQEAFARTWEVLHRFDGRSTWRTFVCGVAYQFWRRHRRGDARSRVREQTYAEMAVAQRATSAPAETSLTLRRAMEELPPDQSAALALCLGAEFTHAEAAAALGLPLGTIKSHITRGRARLQQALGIDPAKGNDDA